MKWKALRQTERGAQGNHTNWKQIDSITDFVLIQCTCHPKGDSQDLRWIKPSQIIKEK